KSNPVEKLGNSHKQYYRIGVLEESCFARYLMQKAPIYQVQDKKKEELRYYSRLLLKKPGSVSSPFLCLSPVDDTCDSRAKLCKIGEECHEIIFPEYIRSSLDYQICPILSIPPLYFIVIFTVFTIFFLSFYVYLTFVFLLFYSIMLT